MRRGARSRPVDRTADQPRARQTATIPGGHCGTFGEHARLAGARHRALVDLAQVAGKQREAVGVVAEQVAFDRHLGDRPGHRLSEPGTLQQRLREIGQ